MAGEEKTSSQVGAITSSFDQYEYVGVIIPGATLLFGLLVIWSEPFRAMLGKDFSLGVFGLFLIAAYVTGHLVRAIAELFEHMFWWCFGGMPTDWAPENKHHLLDPHQHKALQRHLTRLLGKSVKLDSYKNRRSEWRSVVREIYVAVARAKSAARVDAFNRTYGMMIGVTMALLIIGLVLLIQVAYGDGTKLPLSPGIFWLIDVLIFVTAGLMLHRAYTFGKTYGRELLVQFLDLR